jgi:hypothetical protein
VVPRSCEFELHRGFLAVVIGVFAAEVWWLMR